MFFIIISVSPTVIRPPSGLFLILYFQEKMETKMEPKIVPTMADRNEKTLILLKPDAVQRGLIGKIIGRFERKGYKMVAAKLVKVSS